MELRLQNQLQVKIADMLWEAESQSDVNKILRVFGHDARVVYELMIAATFDEVQDTQDACRVIQQVVDNLGK